MFEVKHYAYKYIITYVDIHICKCTYTYIYMLIYIHTYIYAYHIHICISPLGYLPRFWWKTNFPQALALKSQIFLNPLNGN